MIAVFEVIAAIISVYAMFVVRLCAVVNLIH